MSENFNLWNEDDIPLYMEGEEIPTITPYIVENSKACIVICPGGGYCARAPHEGDGYAKWLRENGVSSFVVDYRVSPYRYPAPQYDAMRAMKIARYYVDKYGYDKNKIGIMGSSAGGHLAGSVATATDDMGYKITDEIDNIDWKPNFAVLCYPVVSLIEFAHNGSRINLMGENESNVREAQKLCIDKRVTKATPPMFIWHTSEDQAVPIENSLLLAKALSEKGVPFELHSYQKGYHGLGLLTNDFEGTKAWSDALLTWLKINDLK